MDIATIIPPLSSIVPALLSLLGASVAAIAMYQSTKNLKSRLRVERKFAHCLAKQLKNRNIYFEVSVELNKVIVKSEIKEEDIENLKKQLHESLKFAIQELVESERDLVKKSLEQPSKQGQVHYLKKLVINSLQELEHGKA
ncbi:hypothetical protein I2492_09945 [Budviciaceae bacterium CWB-B4]|uniref:Uncharacterized protein n=1 Tax=Limnobaculum xujianqingii TaxID=2738837 RepID=A0A9D7FTR5_9GAMM|nr:hypothetical protein [Limnobaculum xujianqingii]MBK5073625.1 hypothetical protein [Limnobaculum xujianqingii]MBK5176644.1 hypothetical protein [Limnobaculum xujianqingii]